jgi:hypothetical protein
VREDDSEKELTGAKPPVSSFFVLFNNPYKGRIEKEG